MFFDTDCGGVVHNIAYLRIIETCRTKLAGKLGMNLREMAITHLYPVVVRTEIDYRKPARLGDELVIHGKLESIERLIRRGIYKGPLLVNWVQLGGGSEGPNPRNLLEMVNRLPENAIFTVESFMRYVHPLTTMAIANSAPLAPEVNHLWPLITHSPSTSSALVCSVVGSEPETSGSVIEKQLRISPSSSGLRNRPR